MTATPEDYLPEKERFFSAFYFVFHLVASADIWAKHRLLLHPSSQYPWGRRQLAALNPIWEAL